MFDLGLMVDNGLLIGAKESYVEGVRSAFLKNGSARISLALPLFCPDILSMYLMACRASSPTPGRYFCKFLLGYSLNTISRFSANLYPSLH